MEVSISVNKGEKYVKKTHYQVRATREGSLQIGISIVTPHKWKENQGDTKGERHLEPLGRSRSPGRATQVHTRGVYKRFGKETGSGCLNRRASLVSGLKVQVDLR